MKHGRITKKRSVSNFVELKFGLKPSEFLPLLQLPPNLRDREKIVFRFQKLLLQFSTNLC